ncbi:MAG: hypothetical protein A4E55_02489 [Pelotomaculum sp. PtaU1.Bin035]|nr:MAG: hypothetical protein A4E55_02489 [Pelotomaculum sp. PtaU1.Bin035]
MSGKGIYKVLDDKGRVLIPRQLRAAAGMSRGDIIKLGVQKGVVTAKKVDLIEVGDQSPQAVEAYVFSPSGPWKSKPSFPSRRGSSPSSKKTARSKEAFLVTDKKIFTPEDCIETGRTMSIAGRVVALKPSSLPPEYRDGEHQLYFCEGGGGSRPNPIGRSVFTVSLANGERARWNRGDVMGILKPELLPDTARLHLSQIRPRGTLDLKEREPKYSGYSFLPDGRYAAGVWLCGEKEVKDYIEMQKDYQHQVMICDRDDFCVLEMVNGEIIHPSPKVLQDFCQGREPGGQNMNL